MASYGEESVDSYFYSSYNPYRYSRPREAAWRFKGYVSPYGEPSEAFNNQQRAQLKSILSQINPKLTPRLRKANTKDVAVQVNPKTDASVQCSIGPRTLFPAGGRRQGEEPAGGGGAGGGSPAPVRYPRTLAVYSPVAYRSVTSFLLEDDVTKEAPSEEEKETDGRKSDEEPAAGEEEEKEEEEEEERSTKPAEQRKKSQNKQVKTADAQPAAQGPKGKARVRFQFLEQKYGYYHCRECSLRWESAYVWCVQGTNKVYFKQYCRKCQKEFNPYRVEDITCHTCNKARCSCAITQRHVDPKRPHRQDLCGRCKGKRLSCDSTFSFKYII
ncbi:zygote arrest protein 1 [Thalassophryne amazonica]|uniref:zygote arrest protein 1 n=1 Tax=Thalassophryne amazonica TaxID=390379 RepID=UPI001470F9A9|nr:zygote arrest protein 1 [Thalassophryne amazonica]